MDEHKLRVGAGEAKIDYAPETFPTGGGENYTGVHDYPYVHVIALEHCGSRYAILAIDIVVIPDADRLKDLTARELGIDPSNIVITNAHVLTTPHLPHNPKSDTERHVGELMRQALEQAVLSATSMAKSALRPAVFGYGCGHTNFNVNRVIKTDQGWDQGTCDEGDTDPSLPVFRFDDLDGNTIAIMYIVNCAAGMLEHTHSDDGGRLVSNDIAGASQQFVKQEFPGCVAIYLAGATGDQWQSLRGMFGVVGRHGVYRERDLGDKGWLLLELMGERLGQQIVRTADSICCKDVDVLTLSMRQISLPGRVDIPPDHSHPGKQNPIIKGEDVRTMVSIMTFDGVAWVGATPEIQVKTVRAIKESSPFEHTAFSGWTNDGASSCGSYMATDEMYDMKTYQSKKSRFYLGAAQRMERETVNFLHDVKAAVRYGTIGERA